MCTLTRACEAKIKQAPEAGAVWEPHKATAVRKYVCQGTSSYKSLHEICARVKLLVRSLTFESCCNVQKNTLLIDFDNSVFQSPHLELSKALVGIA